MSEKEKPRTLVRVEVSRPRWARGEDDSTLLAGKGIRRCCIGFACGVAGIIAKNLRGKGCVDTLTAGSIQKWNEKFPRCQQAECMGISDHLDSAYEINDNPHTTDHMRESLLKTWGRKHGISFVFTGE